MQLLVIVIKHKLTNLCGRKPGNYMCGGSKRKTEKIVIKSESEEFLEPRGGS